MDWEQAMRGARYHEAGHAVAAYHHGYTIKGVTVTADVWRADYSHPAYIKMLGEGAVVTLAGFFADMLAGWGEIRPQPWGEYLEGAQMQREGELERGDELAVLEALEARAALLATAEVDDALKSSYKVPTLEELYDATVEQTRRLVSESWPQIEAVASALEETPTLDGSEVVRIIEGAG